MKLKIDKENIYKKDIIIDEGYYMPKLWEILRETETNKELNQLLKDGYVWCNSYNGVSPVGFGYSGGLFLIVGDDRLFDFGRSRRVLVKK